MQLITSRYIYLHGMIAGFETLHAVRQLVQSTGDAACEEQSRNHGNAKRAATDSKCEEELIPLFGDEATNLRVSFDYCDGLAGMVEDRCVTADPTSIFIVVNIATHRHTRIPRLKKLTPIGWRNAVAMADEGLLLKHDDELSLKGRCLAERSQNVDFILRQPINSPSCIENSSRVLKLR